jgi:hypothetical protein
MSNYPFLYVVVHKEKKKEDEFIVDRKGNVSNSLMAFPMEREQAVSWTRINGGGPALYDPDGEFVGYYEYGNDNSIWIIQRTTLPVKEKCIPAGENTPAHLRFTEVRTEDAAYRVRRSNDGYVVKYKMHDESEWQIILNEEKQEDAGKPRLWREEVHARLWMLNRLLW